jgi:ABC-type Mn2+/Zn2+ transport system permease subunit
MILMIGWGVGVLITIAGIALSYKLDAPTAPVIVAGLALAFFTLLAVRTVPGKGTV